MESLNRWWISLEKKQDRFQNGLETISVGNSKGLGLRGMEGESTVRDNQNLGAIIVHWIPLGIYEGDNSEDTQLWGIYSLNWPSLVTRQRSMCWNCITNPEPKILT